MLPPIVLLSFLIAIQPPLTLILNRRRWNRMWFDISLIFTGSCRQGHGQVCDLPDIEWYVMHCPFDYQDNNRTNNYHFLRITLALCSIVILSLDTELWEISFGTQQLSLLGKPFGLISRYMNKPETFEETEIAYSDPHWFRYWLPALELGAASGSQTCEYSRNGKWNGEGKVRFSKTVASQFLSHSSLL